MHGFRFDWRWLVLIGLIAILANARSLPWFVTALALAVPGGYLLMLAWRTWEGTGGRSGGNGRRVTYWRGQRIETHGPPRRVRPETWSAIAPILIYAIGGMVLMLAALAVVARAL
ncbi:MAG: hypothetical protein ACUVS4_01475 [Chloroflexaceae bacterium]